jgi:hypothetical protein
MVEGWITSSFYGMQSAFTDLHGAKKCKTSLATPPSGAACAHAVRREVVQSAQRHRTVLGHQLQPVGVQLPVIFLAWPARVTMWTKTCSGSMPPGVAEAPRRRIRPVPRTARRAAALISAGGWGGPMRRSDFPFKSNPHKPLAPEGEGSALSAIQNLFRARGVQHGFVEIKDKGILSPIPTATMTKKVWALFVKRLKPGEIVHSPSITLAQASRRCEPSARYPTLWKSLLANASIR